MKVLIDHDLNVQVFLKNVSTAGNAAINEQAVIVTEGDGASAMDAAGNAGGETLDANMNGNMPGAAMKDSLLASWPFVIGISSATFIFSIILGILLAKRKIKKGYELYED
jgi:hypothetical protein